MARDDWPSVLRVSLVEDSMALVDVLGVEGSPPLGELDRLGLMRISSTCRSGPEQDLVADAAARAVGCFPGWGVFVLAADADWTKQAVRTRIPIDTSTWPAAFRDVDAHHVTVESDGYRVRAVFFPVDLGGSGAALEALGRLPLRSVCLLSDEFDRTILERWVGERSMESSLLRPWARDVALVDPHHIVMRWSGFGQPCPAFDFVGPLATVRRAVQRLLSDLAGDGPGDSAKPRG